MAGVDISALLRQVWDAVWGMRADISELKSREYPAMKSGTAATRAAAGTIVGERYFATDTGAESYWTGSAWTPIAGGTGISTLTGTDPIVVSGSGSSRAIAFTPASSVNFQAQQITNFRVENASSAPTGSVGRAYVNTVGNTFQVYMNSAWRTLADIANVVTGVSVTAPVTNTGTSLAPNLGLSVTTTNDGGAIVKQGSYAGTSQAGNIHVTGTIGADTRFNINSIPMLERGSTFPSGVDGQQYFHSTYRSWFVYVGGSVNLWYQQFPGVFNGSFPTVSSGDNTVAPHIQVKRVDQNDRIYYYDGATWLPIAGTWVVLNQVCRILIDTTSRATGYTNSALQVTGVTDLNSGSFTLPSTLRAIQYQMFLLTAASANVRMVVENPDFVVGAITMQGTTQTIGANTAYSGSGVVSLSSLGRLRYVYGGSANVTTTLIDVWAYMT